MKIIIVGNHAGVRCMLRSAVAELADDIRECIEGMDVLAIYSEFQPATVLLDARAPYTEALQTVRAIRLAHRAARVLLVVDDDSDELRIAARNSGASGYVSRKDLSVLPTLIRSAAMSEAQAPTRNRPASCVFRWLAALREIRFAGIGKAPPTHANLPRRSGS